MINIAEDTVSAMVPVAGGLISADTANPT